MATNHERPAKGDLLRPETRWSIRWDLLTLCRRPSNRLHPYDAAPATSHFFLPENSLTVSYSKTDAAASPNDPRKVTDCDPARMVGGCSVPWRPMVLEVTDSDPLGRLFSTFACYGTGAEFYSMEPPHTKGDGIRPRAHEQWTRRSMVLESDRFRPVGPIVLNVPCYGTGTEFISMGPAYER